MRVKHSQTEGWEKRHTGTAGEKRRNMAGSITARKRLPQTLSKRNRYHPSHAAHRKLSRQYKNRRHAPFIRTQAGCQRMDESRSSVATTIRFRRHEERRTGGHGNARNEAPAARRGRTEAEQPFSAHETTGGMQTGVSPSIRSCRGQPGQRRTWPARRGTARKRASRFYVEQMPHEILSAEAHKGTGTPTTVPSPLLSLSLPSPPPLLLLPPLFLLPTQAVTNVAIRHARRVRQKV